MLWLSTGQSLLQGYVNFARWNSGGIHCCGGSWAGPEHSAEMTVHVLSLISMIIEMKELSRKAWETHCRRASIIVKTHNMNTSSSLFHRNAGQAMTASAKESVLFELTCENVLMTAVLRYLNTVFFIQVTWEHANLYKSQYKYYPCKILNVFKRTCFWSRPFVIKV